ncbi:hypothetical protein VW23_006625 [Devosia insulae DS-56]|uniref:Uncharacterized protein n=1 Tax=Devosia insulae DS-56 TaxID=1116389 RepID=A0A1E5XHV0_9HYPH|nr:hypothetical protein [Devosia insulae]OEO28064.1 hypothetical protein VW23_006625 [Devosia insulae DS-56]
MLLRPYIWMILLLSLLGGALAAAWAAAADLQVMTATVSLADAGEPVMAESAPMFDAGEVHDTPPLMTETASADVLPLWGAAWKPAKASSVARIPRFLPDEPPRRIA